MLVAPKFPANREYREIPCRGGHLAKGIYENACDSKLLRHWMTQIHNREIRRRQRPSIGHLIQGGPRKNNGTYIIEIHKI